jgi:hypothetical protein
MPRRGRLEVEDPERQRIVIDLLERVGRGEFAERDVLMPPAPQPFEPFLPA